MYRTQCNCISEFISHYFCFVYRAMCELEYTLNREQLTKHWRQSAKLHLLKTQYKIYPNIALNQRFALHVEKRAIQRKTFVFMRFIGKGRLGAILTAQSGTRISSAIFSQSPHTLTYYTGCCCFGIGCHRFRMQLPLWMKYSKHIFRIHVKNHANIYLLLIVVTSFGSNALPLLCVCVCVCACAFQWMNLQLYQRAYIFQYQAMTFCVCVFTHAT